MYLDTVQVKVSPINDYSLLGIQYGYTFSRVSFSPTRQQRTNYLPVNVGITYSRYGKMFGYLPYFGFQVGLFYGEEAYTLRTEDDTRYVARLDTLTGETAAVMKMIEVPFMAHAHIDFWKMKAIINLGIYGGYRLSIHRTGEYAKPQYADSFREYNRRFDYGIKGGAGLGFILDPIEIHLQAMVKWSWSSLYNPDYNSRYYYRYATPFNIIVSLGVHYQLTRRQGRSTADLRRQAHEEIYGY